MTTPDPDRLTILGPSGAEDERLRELLKEARRIIGKFIRADEDSPPVSGLADCRDRDGRHYQSQWLADIITNARALLADIDAALGAQP